MKHFSTYILAIALLTLFFHGQTFGQTRTITAQVFGMDMEPLAGVTVKVENDHHRTVTDENGFFTIEVDQEEDITFNYVGYKVEKYSSRQIESGFGGLVEMFADGLLPEVVIVTSRVPLVRADHIICCGFSSDEMEEQPEISSLEFRSNFEESVISSWSYFPNPTIDGVTIQSELTEGIIQVYSMDGRKLKSTVITAQNTRIDLTVLPDGAYVLVYENKGVQDVIGKVSRVSK